MPNGGTLWRAGFYRESRCRVNRNVAREKRGIVLRVAQNRMTGH